MTESQNKTPKPFLFFVAGIVITLLILVTIQQVMSMRNASMANEPSSFTESNLLNEGPLPTITSAPQLTVQVSPTPIQTSTSIFVPVDLNSDVDEDKNLVGVLAFSMMDGLNQHIFVYHPQFFPLTRLTNNLWDDTHPAFSHDGKKLAYASNQDGNWDIFILDLQTYELTNLTAVNSYESHPSWSPDDQWLVYESDRNGNLDLFIQAVAAPQESPIQLTLSEVDEYQPAWSANGRLIAYTSLASGNEDIWIADLDEVENRYTNISNQPETLDMEAFWSPIDNSIYWGATQTLGQMIVSTASEPIESIPSVVTGSLAQFHPSSNRLAVVYHTDAGSNVGIFDHNTNTMAFPFQSMPGRINGITWGNQNIGLLLPLLNQASISASPATWSFFRDSSTAIPANRMGLVKLTDIDTIYPYLHDEVDESFSELHMAVAQILGWDFLKTLNNAYVPITQPAPPMIENYWLYSGRAFEIDDAPAVANWLVTVREDIDGKSFWRIYLKPIDQSGAVGDKLHQRAWSFDSRSQGNPEAYEQGGAYTQSIPQGYWVDFSELANQYGWTRIPALLNWRTYYPGTQHTIFVQKDYLDLATALQEIYPPEALLPPATDSLFPIRPTAVPEEEDE